VLLHLDEKKKGNPLSSSSKKQPQRDFDWGEKLPQRLVCENSSPRPAVYFSLGRGIFGTSGWLPQAWPARLRSSRVSPKLDSETPRPARGVSVTLQLFMPVREPLHPTSHEEKVA